MTGSVSTRCACPPMYDSRGRRRPCGRGHGSWGFTLDIAADPTTGKRRRRRRSGFATKHDAETALAQAITEVDQGRYRDDGRRTVANYLQEWIEAKIANGIRLTTERNYRQHIDSYLVPALGHLRLRDLQPGHVSQCFGTSPSPTVAAPARFQRHPSVVSTRRSGQPWAMPSVTGL